MSNEKDINLPSYHNNAHDQMERFWTIIDAVSGGTLGLRDEGPRWLPLEPAEDQRDYSIRLRRAIFYNIFEKTLHSLVGLVFRKDIQISSDNPDRIQELWENVDNAGMHGVVFAKEAFTVACKYGHAVIYTDMPSSLSENATLYDERLANRRPYFVLYNPDQIINWQTTVVNGQVVLSMIVFEEETIEPSGLYGEEEVTKYRVLRPGSWELYREVENKAKREVEYILEDSGQTSLSYIPISIVYSRKTGFLTSKPPMLDLAITNIAHYQKYSDYSTYLHISSRPILWFRGRDISKGVEAIGPYTFFDVDGQNGNVDFAETAGTALAAAKNDIDHLEKQMAVLGLSFLTNKPSVEKTATEVLLGSVKEESDLATAARSLQDALEVSLQHMADYEGIEAGSVALGATMTELNLTTDEMRVWLDSVDVLFSRDTIYDVFKKAGKLPEDFSSEVESEKMQTNSSNLGANLLTAFEQGK